MVQEYGLGHVRPGLERHPRSGGQPGGTGSDPFKVDEDKALEELFLAWGDIFAEFACTDGKWTAVSRDDEHRKLTGDTPDELAAAIRADWARGGTA